jgi:damage control phosphatase ARMT1-like protein
MPISGQTPFSVKGYDMAGRPKKQKQKAPNKRSQPGKTPEMEAWMTAFFIENHLDHPAYPDQVATPEQIRFMVYLEGDERYYPCSDRMYNAIMNKNDSALLQEKYLDGLRRVLGLVESQIEEKKQRDYLKSLVEIKFKHETRDEIMIPSRVEKRLLRIFLNRTQIEDPSMAEKETRNQRAAKALASKAFHQAITRLEDEDMPRQPASLKEIREMANYLELKRLFALSVETALWESDVAKDYTEQDYLQIFRRRVSGDGVTPLLDFLGIQESCKFVDTKEAPQARKILWLADEAGEIMVDFAIIRYLSKLGHKIIISFKEGSLYTKVDFMDAQDDEALKDALDGAFLITDKNLSKNDLGKILRSENPMIAMADGTRENVNLLLVSTTFARVFKEVDGIISRGHDQRRRFFDTHFRFTRDIFNISRDQDGDVLISCKPKHPSVIKFSLYDLEKKAKSIIEQMQNAKKDGMTVIFYSGIIGSIPGRIEVAKKVMSVFIRHLKRQSAKTFIINPSQYYEPGMDADDLMYMWEIVQRSGMIDNWRFQTYDDIAAAFKIMKKKVPPEWVGKDATYSTGCTKEMAIAVDVQQQRPEMQIIGPSREKFMRRSEYGVGKMFDQRIGEVSMME